MVLNLILASLVAVLVVTSLQFVPRNSALPLPALNPIPTPTRKASPVSAAPA